MDKYLVSPTSSLKDGILKLDQNSGIGLVVVNPVNKLLGTLTDGDIRRALIRGSTLETRIEDVMCLKPFVASKTDGFNQMMLVSEQKNIKLIPIVEGGTVIDLFVFGNDDFENVPVVLMAGGLGSRLGDLTKDCPKPMLKVGGKPVLERIINNFTKVGFRKFFISVNFMAETIENYFQDGSRFNCEIVYLKEDKKLGTAGPLSLLPAGLVGPLVVTNGDLLTQVDYRRLIGFHNDHNSKITMCARKFDIQIPYGVINLDAGKITSIEEKPLHTFNVNAGVYVLEAELTYKIAKNKYLDMPTFIEEKMNSIDVHLFPLIEKWIDIGKASDLEFARKLYGESSD